MISYAFREYFQKIFFTSRFFVIVLGMFTALRVLFRGMASAMKKLGYQAGVWEMLPAFSFYDTGALIYFGLFIFLISVIPVWDGSLHQILRLGKRKWLLMQYFNVFLTSVIYYLLWTVGFILAIFPEISWSNVWSSLVTHAIDPNVSAWFWLDMDMNVNLVFLEEIVKAGSPLKIYLLCFWLYVLGGTFVGMVMVTGNICFRRGTGTILAYVLIAMKAFLDYLPILFGKHALHFEGYKQVKNLLLRLQYYISPMYQSDLLVMILHDARPLSQRVAIGSVYFLICIIVVTVFGMWMVKRIDLCQE